MSVYKRRSGKWAVLVDLDPTPLGGRQRKSIGTYRTRKEAERAERQAIEARDRGIDLSPSTVSLSAVLERYCADCGARNLATKTVERYREIATQYIAPHIGSLALARLRPAHVSAWLHTLAERGGHDGRALSAKTVRHGFALLNAALRFAQRLDLVGRNVCESVRPPKVAKSPADAISSEDLAELLASANGTRWSAFVTLALATGARRGELCALDWADVDFERGMIAIRKSLSQTRTGGLALKSTKTGATRLLPLSPVAIDALRRQRIMQAEERLRAGSAYERGEGVFADELGRRISPMSATNAFARLAKKAGIKTTRLHDARHSAATALLTAGVDVRTVGGILGHAAASTTLNIYGHLIEGGQRRGLDALGATLERAAGTKKG